MDLQIIDMKFLELFPLGLEDENWKDLGKKHNPTKVMTLINEDLSQSILKELLNRKDYNKICEISLKIIKKASVVSVFEKVAMQNFFNYSDTKVEFSHALYNFLYNFNENSFSAFVDVLAKHKEDKKANVAKWPIVSVFKAYQNPDKYVFVKPNTIKATAKFLEFDIAYKSYPTFKTFKNIEKMITSYKNKSTVCKNENLMIAQAVLFTVLNG